MKKLHANADHTVGGNRVDCELPNRSQSTRQRARCDLPAVNAACPSAVDKDGAACTLPCGQGCFAAGRRPYRLQSVIPRQAGPIRTRRERERERERERGSCDEGESFAAVPWHLRVASVTLVQKTMRRRFLRLLPRTCWTPPARVARVFVGQGQLSSERL